MERVRVRELRQRASELLRRVEAGETIEITDRGRPVAQLTPCPPATGLQAARDRGDTIPATKSFNDLPPPLDLPPGAELPSAVLERLRRDER